MWSWAAKRTAVSSSVASSITRQLDRAHGDALVGDADAHVARELLLGEQVLDRLAEAPRVVDLALADDARRERRDRRAAPPSAHR